MLTFLQRHETELVFAKIKMQKKVFILLFSLLSFTFILLLGEGEQTRTSNLKCLTCHSEGSPSPLAKNFKINENAFNASIHGQLDCTDCHQAALKEIEGDIPHQKDLPDVNCTQSCHQENRLLRPGQSPLYYPDSVHGKDYVKGIKDVPVCTDCHNEHDILSPQDLSSRLYAIKIAEVCSGCHDNLALARTYGFLTSRLKT